MATSKAQRVGIWAIAILMIVSTVAMFVGMVLSMQNQSSEQQQQADLEKKMEEEYRKRLALLEPLDDYKAEPFEASSVKKLKVETLKSGSGRVATEKSKVTAYYFGWTPDGKIFDSSKKKGEKAEPADFPLDGVIQGWTKGLTGVKEGSVVKLTIPADLAYGAQGNPPSIDPDTPLMFVVELKKVQ